MELKLKKGDRVRQLMPKPVEGVVDRFTFDDSTGKVGVVVQNVDEDGTVHERAFAIDQLEAIEPAPAPAA